MSNRLIKTAIKGKSWNDDPLTPAHLHIPIFTNKGERSRQSKLSEFFTHKLYSYSISGPKGRMISLLLFVNITGTLVIASKQSRWVMLYKFTIKDPESTGN